MIAGMCDRSASSATAWVVQKANAFHPHFRIQQDIPTYNPLSSPQCHKDDDGSFHVK